MIQKIAYGILMLAFFACQNIEKSKKPENLIGEDKMIEILLDIAFVKAAKNSHKKLFDTENINPEDFILKKHGVDSLVFVENNAWYTDQLETYERIFKRVKDSLAKSRAKYEKLKNKKDSLTRIQDSFNRFFHRYKTIGKFFFYFFIFIHRIRKTTFYRSLKYKPFTFQ